MVCDLIMEGHGYLRDQHLEAHLLVEPQYDEYFTMTFIQQVDKAIDVFERSFLQQQATSFSIVHPAISTLMMPREQSIKGDTQWNGEVQQVVSLMVNPKD